MSSEHTEDISHDEIKEGQLVHVEPAVVLSTEQHIKMEIVKFNPIKAGIAAMNKKAKGIKIAGPEDTVGYKKVKALWQEFKNTRITADKLRKDLKADYIAIGKAIEGAYNEIEGGLATQEERLYKEWKEFDNAAEIKKQAEEKKLDDQLDDRVKLLIENGMLFTGKFYTIGDTISMDVVTLRGMSGEDFENLLAIVMKANETLKQAAEQKRLDEEAEKKKQEDLRIENDRKAKELLDREEELRRKENEMIAAQNKINETRTGARIKQLEDLGMRYDHSSEYWKSDDVYTPLAVVKEAPEDTWSKEFDTIVKWVGEANAAKELKAKEEADKQATDLIELNKQKEIKRLSELSDTAKAIEYVNAVSKIPIPELEDMGINHIINGITHEVVKAKKSLEIIQSNLN